MAVASTGAGVAAAMSVGGATGGLAWASVASGPVASAMLTPGVRNSTTVEPVWTMCANSCASQLVSRTQPCDCCTNRRDGVGVPWMP